MYVVLFLNGNGRWRAGDWYPSMKDALDSVPKDMLGITYKIVYTPAVEAWLK